MFNSILIVCVGNICRSPIGERLFRKYLPQKDINSAGVGALVGKGADKSAQEVSFKHGLELDGHIAKQLTRELCQKYDLILVMERKHLEAVTNICAEARGKTMLYGHWLESKEIVDPYKRDIEVFEHIYNLLDEAANKWAQVLNR